MGQATRTFIGFLGAPAVPSALLYAAMAFKHYSDGPAFVLPLMLLPLGYVAMLIIGVPVYLLLQRRRIRSFSAYALSGLLIGPGFYLLTEVLPAYPGQLTAALARAPGPMLFAMAYSGIAAVVFWAIAIRGAANQLGAMPS